MESFVTTVTGVRIRWAAAFALWVATVGFGFHSAMQWDSKPGLAGKTPALRPARASKPWLIVALHSQCPCSLATLDNLVSMSSEDSSRLRITLVMTGPDLVHSPLIQRAKALPNAEKVMLSEQEVLKCYGARTSGQALLYDRNGELVFSGGLTDSRGQAGESAGMSALHAVIAGNKCVATLPVYGCSLQTPR